MIDLGKIWGNARGELSGKTSVKGLGEKRGDRRGEKRGEKLSMNRQKIVGVMKEDPSVTHLRLVEIVGIGPSNIEKNINYLKEKGIIHRVGPVKGGYWKVLK